MKTGVENPVMCQKFGMVVEDVVHTDTHVTEVNLLPKKKSNVESENVPCSESLAVHIDAVHHTEVGDSFIRIMMQEEDVCPVDQGSVGTVLTTIMDLDSKEDKLTATLDMEMVDGVDPEAVMAPAFPGSTGFTTTSISSGSSEIEPTTRLYPVPIFCSDT